jgi:hypothetical protein
MPNVAEPAPEEAAIQDVVALLLHGAVQVSHALDKFHSLAGHPANTDQVALNDVTEAVATMARVRSALVTGADRLSASPSRT